MPFVRYKHPPQTEKNMNIRKIVVGQLDVNCYIICDDSNSDALVIDPGDEPEKIIEFIDAAGLQPKYILFTHAHYDHVCAAKELHDQYNAVIVMHEQETTTYHRTAQLCISWGYAPEDFPEPQRLVKDNDSISVGTMSFRVIHTPGHSPGSICLLGGNTLFSGDTLFKGSVGRTDLPEGDFRLLLESLKKLSQLPPETRVLCGHDTETTIGEEIRDNPFLKDI